MNILLSAIPLFLLTLLIPGLAHAHTVPGMEGNNFLAGLTHPVLGLDHLLAMIGVGVISAQIGGRAIWTVPASFVVVMAIGGFIGINSIDWFGLEIAMSLVEQGIILSVIFLGLVIAIDKKMPEILAMFCVAFFAFFHGYAHGNEFPEYDNVQWLYVLGFMVGTAGLHITGVVIGLASEQLKQGPRILRHLGSIMAGIGIHMAIGYVEYSMFWEK